MIRLLTTFAIVTALAGPAAAETQGPQATMTAGTSAHNAWLGRSFVQRFLGEPNATSREAVAEQIISPDYVQHDPLAPPGRKGLEGYASTLFASFPDAKTELQDVIATPDRVVARYVFTGTLSGAPMMGAPAKGQKVHVNIIDIWRVQDGKLYEHWDQIDWTSYLAQLGLPGLPAPFYQLAGVKPPAAP